MACSHSKFILQLWILQAAGETPWTEDQPFARPLLHRTTQTQKERSHTYIFMKYFFLDSWKLGSLRSSGNNWTVLTERIQSVPEGTVSIPGGHSIDHSKHICPIPKRLFHVYTLKHGNLATEIITNGITERAERWQLWYIWNSYCYL